MANEPDYGIDAPRVILYLFAAGILCGSVALLYPRITIGQITFLLDPGLLYSVPWFFLPVTLMLVYSKVGKFRHRDRMLAKVSWTGDETVLDVGAGRGLLLIGAAKRLTSGYATGIDIWNAEDLSGNSPEALLQNIVIEGVGGMVDVKSQDARQMSFHDGTFNVVLSNLCLHNIYQLEGRHKALHEIARVLKPGGIAVISDFKHMQEYAGELENCGLAVEMCPLDWTGTFPPLRILVARNAA